MSATPKELYALQPGSRVLVTGANGYIASHIVDTLLSLGYIVRGTVRAEKPWLDELFTSKYGAGHFETAIVPELDDKEALAKVLDGVSGLVHVEYIMQASDVSFNSDASKVIPSVVSATETVLRAAAEAASVTRVVLTSSSSAALIPRPGVEGIVVTKDTWNDATVQAAWDEKTPADIKPFAIYAASKTEGERAAWKWVQENQPSFTFNTVLPNMAIGKILHPEITGSTMKWTADLLQGYGSVLKFLPPQWYINVTDVARIHVLGLLDPNVQSERLFAFAAPFRWTDIITIFQKLRPHNQKLVAAPANELSDLSDIQPAKRAESLLKAFFGRAGWVGLEESLREGIDSLGY